MAKNIEMNVKLDGGYEVLYPSSTIGQIQGLQSQLDGKLSLSGGTMTGDLILNGNPTSGLQAATKNYVDNWAPSDEFDGWNLYFNSTLYFNVQSGNFYEGSFSQAPAKACMVRIKINSSNIGSLYWGSYRSTTICAVGISATPGSVYTAFLMNETYAINLQAKANAYLDLSDMFRYTRFLSSVAGNMNISAYWK